MTLLGLGRLSGRRRLLGVVVAPADARESGGLDGVAEHATIYEHLVLAAHNIGCNRSRCPFLEFRLTSMICRR